MHAGTHRDQLSSALGWGGPGECGGVEWSGRREVMGRWENLAQEETEIGDTSVNQILSSFLPRSTCMDQSRRMPAILLVYVQVDSLQLLGLTLG